MKFDKLLLAAVAAMTVTVAAPGTASAQYPGTQAQRSQNAQATADMRSRMAAAEDRIVAHQRRGKVPGPRAAAMRTDIRRAQAEMARFQRQQGFVSAAELASYDRLLVAVDAELGSLASARSYGNDALPSAEVVAFKRADARLRYRYAQIEYDAKGCAVYQGTALDGRVRQEALRDAAGKPICSRR